MSKTETGSGSVCRQDPKSKQSAENPAIVSNILDYIRWRGDLSFSKAAFNEVDAALISLIVGSNRYSNAETIAPKGEHQRSRRRQFDQLTSD